MFGGPDHYSRSGTSYSNIPNFLIQESIYKSRDFFDDIVVEPFEWENGDLIPSQRPGIGMELDEEKKRIGARWKTFDVNADDKRRTVDVPIAAVGKSKSNAPLRLVAAELDQGS